MVIRSWLMKLFFAVVIAVANVPNFHSPRSRWLVNFFFAFNNSLGVELSSLRYIDVCVNGIPCKALDDSGVQLSIIIMPRP